MFLTPPAPPMTPCDQPLNITWWPFDGLDPAGDPNRKTIPILLSHLLHRYGTKFEWSCPVTTMIIFMIAVKDLLIMTLARSARAVRPEALVLPLWIPTTTTTTPPALELGLCPAICRFANHFKGSPLQVTLNQAQISVIFYFSSFLFSNAFSLGPS